MALVPYLTESDLDESDRPLLARPINLYRALVNSPQGLRHFAGTGRWIRHGCELDPRLRELAILQVGYLTASAYESLIGAVSTLVRANVEAGTVRADLDPETVLRALGGLLFPDPGGDWQGKAANLTDLLWRGMRMSSPR